MHTDSLASTVVTLERNSSQTQDVGGVLLVHLLENGLEKNNREEFVGLARACGAEVLEIIDVNIRHIDPKFYIGIGKTQEIAKKISQLVAELVICNTELSPSQERNLERFLRCRVIDRTRLILDIFALRARSHEGKLQVELAQLGYLATRLVRGWTHLERQKGGIGLRGPGETQLESDRRMLATRVSRLQKQLARVNRRRQISRHARNTKIVALAGYTNAGKSSLFNILCHDHTYVADQLFASLDTTLRRFALPGMQQAVLVDTVGFIENLPHQLIEAFSSTLREVVEADLVLHVCDASDNQITEKMQSVRQILEEIGAANIASLVVWNKCDSLTDQQRKNLPKTIYSDKEQQICVAVSATTGTGIETLKQHIATLLSPKRKQGWFVLSDATSSQNRAYLYKIGAVKQEQCNAQAQVVLYLDIDEAILVKLPGVQETTVPVNEVAYDSSLEPIEVIQENKLVAQYRHVQQQH